MSLPASGDLVDPPAATSPPSDDELRLRDYWRVLVHRRSVILISLIAVLFVTATFTFLAAPTYQATATLQIERRGPEILTYKDVVNLDPSIAGYHDFYQTQYKILQSRAVLAIAAERLDLLNHPGYAGSKRSPIERLTAGLRSLFASERVVEPHSEVQTGRGVGFLAARLAVQPVRQSHLVKVSFMARDPELAADAADAIADAYQEFSLQFRYSTTEQAREFLTKQVAQLEAEITGLERELQEYGVKKEILALRDDTQDISSQALAELNAQYVRAKTRMAVAEARYRSVLDASPESLPEVLQSTLINNLRQQYANIERRHRQMAEKFGENWPAFKELDEELQQSAERLRLESEAIAEQVRAVAQNDYEQAAAEVETLRRRVDEQKSEVQRVNFDAVEIARLKSEIATKRTFLNDLVNRQSETAVSDKLRNPDTSNIRIVDRARVPERPIKPRKLLNLGLALFLGLALGIGAAFAIDHLDNSVKGEHDVTRAVGLPVLASVPLVQRLRPVTDRDGADGDAQPPLGLLSHIDPRAVFSESFRNLRTSLLLASPEHPPRHVLVTSCEPGEGKSTVAANLAIVLSQMGRRVVLIDADLRRPRIHQITGAEKNAGLSGVLTGNAELEDVLQQSTVPDLDVITSGPIPPTPSELLGSSGFTALLERLDEHHGYDHVILDAPPTVQVADSVILATRTDATILVVRPGSTVRDALVQAAARLRHARARVTGVALNAVHDRSGRYYYRYRYGYVDGAGGAEVHSRSRWRFKHRRRRIAGG